MPNCDAASNEHQAPSKLSITRPTIAGPIAGGSHGYDTSPCRWRCPRLSGGWADGIGTTTPRRPMATATRAGAGGLHVYGATSNSTEIRHDGTTVPTGMKRWQGRQEELSGGVSIRYSHNRHRIARYQHEPLVTLHGAGGDIEISSVPARPR